LAYEFKRALRRVNIIQLMCVNMCVSLFVPIPLEVDRLHKCLPVKKKVHMNKLMGEQSRRAQLPGYDRVGALKSLISLHATLWKV